MPRSAFIFIVAVALSGTAQDSGISSAWKSKYRCSIVQKHLPLIQSLAQKYGVQEKAMVYILDYEERDSTLSLNPFEGFNLWGTYKDMMQNSYASRGMIPDRKYLVNPMISPDIARFYPEEFREEDLAYFETVYKEDLLAESCLEKSPVRGGETHWMFSSLGPAQFQIYFALYLVYHGEISNPELIDAFKNEEGTFSLQHVAHALASYDWVSLELLAAELRLAQRIFWSEKNIDISQDYEKLLQLHLCGSFRYFANRKP